jgi:hypothetical protein
MNNRQLLEVLHPTIEENLTLDAAFAYPGGFKIVQDRAAYLIMVRRAVARGFYTDQCEEPSVRLT